MIEDPKALLITIANRKIRNPKWNNSLFSIIKDMSLTDKGDVTEEFIYEMIRSIDVNSKRICHGSFDIIIFDKMVEVKSATEDTSCHFQFNGIRCIREYDYLIVLGISPNDIFFNIYAASDIKSQKIGRLFSMEKGAGKDGSYKLTRKKSQLYDILQFERIIKNLIW